MKPKSDTLGIAASNPNEVKSRTLQRVEVVHRDNPVIFCPTL